MKPPGNRCRNTTMMSQRVARQKRKEGAGARRTGSIRAREPRVRGMTALLCAPRQRLFCTCEGDSPNLHHVPPRGARRRSGQKDRSGLGDNEDLIMEDRLGTSCWGWTLWALAFFGIAIAFIYLLGG